MNDNHKRYMDPPTTKQSPKTRDRNDLLIILMSGTHESSFFARSVFPITIFRHISDFQPSIGCAAISGRLSVLITPASLHYNARHLFQYTFHGHHILGHYLEYLMPYLITTPPTIHFAARTASFPQSAQRSAHSDPGLAFFNHRWNSNTLSRASNSFAASPIIL